MLEKARRGSSALKYCDEEEDREEFASDVSKLARALGRISRIPISKSLDGNVKISSKKMGDWAIELEGMALEFGSREPDYGPSFEPEYDPLRDKGPSTDEFDISGLFAEL
jgi:hypothetical protein